MWSLVFLSVIACGLSMSKGALQMIPPEPIVTSADDITPLENEDDSSMAWKPWFGPKPEELPNSNWILVSHADGSPISGLAAFRARHNQALIVSGTDATDGLQNYMVSLQLEYKGRMYHICGGSLWTRSRVVTAAHCLAYVDDYPHKVGLGYYQLSVGLGIPGSQLIKVAKAVKKPGFSQGNGFPNDVGELTLESDATYNQRVQPINIVKNTPDQFIGMTVSLTGWGQTDAESSSADILQYAEYKVISKEDCKKYWFENILDEHICALGLNEMGSCMGDSGGPLVYSYRGNNYQMGIVSWGSSTCRVDLPSIYSSPYYSWDFLVEQRFN